MDANEINKINQIVLREKWDSLDGVRPDGKTMLDILLDFMSPLSRNERDLVTDLLDEYLVIRDYNREIIDIMNEIIRLADGQSIIITTVKDYSSQKVKSGAALSFEINSHTHFFPNQHFLFAEDPASERFQNAKGFKVFVDDFIGSGNQLLTMSEYLIEKKLSADADLVVAIVIQEDGKRSLEKAGYTVFSPHQRPKSIQNLIAKSGRNHDDVYAIYDAIEARLSCHADYYRGYGQSEATVSLKKTPNNTLPIFWYQGQNKWPAPFPRPRN